MIISKFLHINAVMLIASLVMSDLCYAGDLAKPQLTKWERFTQHPYACHIPTTLLGGYGLYGLLSAHRRSSWLPTLALTAAPLWAVYVQSVQRKVDRESQLNIDANENIEVKPRTSRWLSALPALGAAALVASLSGYNNNNWLSKLWSNTKLTEPPIVSATEEVSKQDSSDTQRLTSIIDDSKTNVTIDQSKVKAKPLSGQTAGDTIVQKTYPLVATRQTTNPEMDYKSTSNPRINFIDRIKEDSKAFPYYYPYYKDSYVGVHKPENMLKFVQEDQKKAISPKRSVKSTCLTSDENSSQFSLKATTAFIPDDKNKKSDLNRLPSGASSNEAITINDRFVGLIVDNQKTIIESAYNKLEDAQKKYSQNENDFMVLLKAYQLLDKISSEEIKLLFKQLNVDFGHDDQDMLIEQLKKYKINVSPENITNKKDAEATIHALNAIRYQGLLYINAAIKRALKNENHSLQEMFAAIDFVKIYLQEKIDALKTLKHDQLKTVDAYSEYALDTQYSFVDPLKNLINNYTDKHKEGTFDLNERMKEIDQSFEDLELIAIEVDYTGIGFSNSHDKMRIPDDDELNQAYTTLGVSKYASMKTINRRFKELALKFHPDKNPGVDTNEQIKEITNAIRFIRNYKNKQMNK